MADQSDPLDTEREQLRAGFMRKPGERLVDEPLLPEPELCFACPSPSVGYRAFPVGIGRLLEPVCLSCGAHCVMSASQA